MEANAEAYVRQALQMGATDALVIGQKDIVYDPRTLLKCMYGCPDWGHNHTCPSAQNVTMAEYKEMFSRYAWAILIHTHEKHLSQKISFALEQRAYFDGYYFAFSTSDCGLCSECAAVSGENCRFRHMARPAFHSVGIDVYKTVHQLGLPLAPLKEGDEENWYSCIFVE